MSPDAPVENLSDQPQVQNATRPSSIVSIVLLGLTLLGLAGFALFG
jgi:hypothetical protein